MQDRRAAALVPLAAEKVAQLLLQRLLQDQPGAEPPDRLDRISLRLMARYRADMLQHHQKAGKEPTRR